MSFAHSPLWSQIVLPSLALFGLAVSPLGVAVGLGLLFNGGVAIAIFRRWNRWVSSRRALKPFEIPRKVESIGPKPRWNGLVFIVAGAYVAVVLLQVHAARAATATPRSVRARLPQASCSMQRAGSWSSVD